MKLVGIYGKKISESTLPLVRCLLDLLNKHQATLFASSPLDTLLPACVESLPSILPLAATESQTPPLDLMISLGGDGTLLEAVRYVGASETPVLGINLGRMGFLATVGQKYMSTALESFWRNAYSLDRRTLLQLKIEKGLHHEVDFALNEVTFLKQDSSSMITIHASIPEGLQTTYWADGLIVATPTGSTGYSLSCGGPVVVPSARNWVMTPVCPHNLAIRPLVVPDDTVLSFKVESRNHKFLVALDGRSKATTTDTTLTVSKAPFWANLVKIEPNNIFEALRQKLHWGLDVRN